MIKIGIFFGGRSREREVSFAGGRTVYDNLNKEIFVPIPVFVDSLGNFILLDWQNIYKGTIRDFYPPASVFQAQNPAFQAFQVYIESLSGLSEGELEACIAQIGRRIEPKDFRHHFDFAFLCLHGPYGEDGTIQGMLEWYGMPYSGTGIFGSAIGIDKNLQRSLMYQAGFKGPKTLAVTKQTWLHETTNSELLLKDAIANLGVPFVVKAPRQGSSIGISIIEGRDQAPFDKAIDKSFFIAKIYREQWQTLSPQAQIDFVTALTDLKEGIGLPLTALNHGLERANEPAGRLTFYHPADLLNFLNSAFWQHTLILENPDGEETILLEAFIHGREFSCIVLDGEQGQPIALPPTEIVKNNSFFDYRSKYLPGMSRKITPIDLADNQIEAIRKKCVRLYSALQFEVYARIDGFVTAQNEIFLNDPNTTSGMMPSSFFFHQAAEIGLNPSQFLTHIIRASLAARIRTGKNTAHSKNLLALLDTQLNWLKQQQQNKTKVGVIMGGYSAERHISVESGRNIYEKLASSSQYAPIPIFLIGNDHEHELYQIPINIMLKDNADDIRDKIIGRTKTRLIMQKIREEAAGIRNMYQTEDFETKPQKLSYRELAKKVDLVFIALHGRPGEDGQIQQKLEKVALPYNGSGSQSSKISINKYETNELLAKNGLNVAPHQLITKADWQREGPALWDKIGITFGFPLIAKPADDGCSAAVKKICDQRELEAFAQLIFRTHQPLDPKTAQLLKLHTQEEFPQKSVFLIEKLIDAAGASRFMEITGGLLTSIDASQNLVYEVFEPSEALSSGAVLSLEEKFLAGQGQNITPSRFSADKAEQAYISEQVRQSLEKAARIIGVEGYCRTDAFVRIYEKDAADPDAMPKVETIIIEINSLPGMTPATCIFHQCALNGYTPLDFIDRILEYGVAKASLQKVNDL